MIVYSKSTCPNCKMLKLKLDKAGIIYQVNENEEDQIALGLKSLPYLQLDNGTLRTFGDAIRYVNSIIKGEEGMVTQQ